VHLNGEGAAEAVRTSVCGFSRWRCAEAFADIDMAIPSRDRLWISSPETTRRAVDFTGEDRRMPGNT
jgi:phage terminase Nu1 subunit (DNA packaging protein)